MKEVIDLTDDSPPPQKRADKDSKRGRKKEKQEKRLQEREVAREAARVNELPTAPRADREHGRDADEGKRQREHSRERDSDRKRRRRKDRSRDRVPDDQLFFIDETPVPLPSAARYTAAATVEETPGLGLILPAHVSVFGESPAVILPAEPLDSDEDDYIEYLDYDNRKDFVRYYEEEPQEKRTKIVCKKCGAEGEHTTAECHVLICSTCGARDDHPTRSCNIGKTCYTCGMKGHINTDCPNRYSNKSRRDGCERCNSTSHQTSECPALWRLYVYLENEEHEHILETRKAKKGLSLGQGGEGYIADDAWCYNCGGSGHWGDDCREFYHSEPLGDPTAFSYHVLSSGPFPVLEHASDSKAPREWMREVPLPGGVENVGRQARRKEMEKLARRVQQQEADDDPTDWFQNSRSANNRGRSERERERERIPSGPRGSSSKAPPPFKFAATSSKASLLDRLTNPAPRDARDARDRDSRDRASNSKHRGERDHRHERARERERDKDRRPRYTGGYSR